jgi:hypothetical protein
MCNTLQKNLFKQGEMVLMMGDFNVDSRKPYIETEQIRAYPGFKVTIVYIISINHFIELPTSCSE